jgi:uncharacterized repeat protein (TIGR03803 family)
VGLLSLTSSEELVLRFRFVGVALVAVLGAACGGARNSLPGSPGAVSVSSENRVLPPLPAIGSIGRAATSAAQRSTSSIVQSAAVFKTLYAFKGPLKGPDGANPTGLVDVSGTLYGTTSLGGTKGAGTVFKLSTSGAESVLYSFSTAPGNGFAPMGNPIDVNGVLYGTTSAAGSYPFDGTVFKVSLSGAESVLYRFKLAPDGQYPESGLIDVNGTLYGTTQFGGTKGLGSVFKISPSGSESVLYSFKGGSDGTQPLAGLIDVNGTLYGTSAGGGPTGAGTVFKISTSGTESVLYRFKNGTDGASPYAGLIDVSGTLYGTTQFGGANHLGTVFKVSLSGTETVLHQFKGGSDGQYPKASLVDVNGTLYGTTAGDSSSGINGTVFKISPSGAESVLYNFKGGTDGANPDDLIDVNGVLYGTTFGEESPGFGTVFKLTP